MKISYKTHITGGQDGAIFSGLLFRFNHKGHCSVFDLKTACNCDSPDPVASFTLDRADELCPHSNAVMFGNEYFAEDDEFPLLYSNIYNNYASAEDTLKGVCCVYRLKRAGNTFETTLVQLIEIGFTEDADYWRSDPEKRDVRPYGNFTIDREKGIYYAFVMRDKTHTTRYFSFGLPKLSQGVPDEKYGVRRVTLKIEDIIDSFDTEYHRFIQGACTHKGLIYSAEGFTDSAENPPAIRVIDPAGRKQKCFVDIVLMGYTVEPECIDFDGDVCYYSDVEGNLYVLEFDT